ncbi:MAG: Ig-like domain-containing protein, partial [Bifidobacteriaceae bacterium]|nr:Ig-like domain-containing protein [Bifidobacteriaceae bacterium]
ILQANYADGGVSFQVGRKGEAGQRDLEAVFVAGALSEAETLGSLTASAGAVATADGKTAHTAELTVADAYGHGLSGIEVLFELEATKSALFPNGLSTISSRSSADGVVSVTFTDTLGEAVQLTIKIDGQVIARLGFTFSSPPPVGETEPPPTDDPQNDPPPGGTSPNDLPQGGASHGNTSRPEQTPPSDGSTTSATPPASSTPGLTPNPAPARPGPDAGSGAAPSADALTAVGVSQKRIRLTKGAKVRPLAVVYKTDSAKLGRMVWVSSRPSVVKVNRRTGRTLGVSLGKATVTGTSVEKTATGRHLTVKVIVTVVPNRTAVKSLAAAVPKAMKTGAIKVLNARSSPARATGVEFRFHSTNPKVATVDPAGRLTAKRPGTARIQIRAGGKVRTYRITVK